jgi:threonine dehydrogenase-like Zn-dependent dehydrogenase
VAYRDAESHTVPVTGGGPVGATASASLLLNETLRIISSDSSGSSAAR